MGSGQQSRKAGRRGPRHDACYKQLFDHAVVVRDLISGFIAPHLSDELDFSTLEKVPSSFVSSDLKQRHIDRVWRVRFRSNGRWVYFLLEFQSTVNPLMVVRLLTYIGLLYEDICRNKANLGPRGELPEVWPIVIFNGYGKWTAACVIEQKSRDGGHQYRLVLEYIVFRQQEYSLDDLPSDKVVSFLIRLERITPSGEPLHRLMCDLEVWFRKFDKDDNPRQSLAGALSNWFKEYLTMEDKIDSSLDPLDQLEQIKNLAMDWDAPDWAHGWIEESLTEGIAKGREEGLTEGIEKGLTKGRTEVLGAIRKRLYRRVGSRFDPEAVGRLTKHLDQISDPDLLLEISEKIHEGATCAAVLQCLKTDRNRSDAPSGT